MIHNGMASFKNPSLVAEAIVIISCVSEFKMKLNMNVAHKQHSSQYLRNCDTFPGTIHSARNFLYLFQLIGLNKIVLDVSLIIYQPVAVVISTKIINALISSLP